MNHLNKILMLKIIISAIIMASFSLFSQSNSKITDTLTVSGNCEMCKKTIEESLLVKGVKSANWNIATHVLTVTYIPSKISLAEINQLVAKSGYDTKTVKADASAYQALPGCCKYVRK